MRYVSFRVFKKCKQRDGQNYILFIQSSKANDGFTESVVVLAGQVRTHFIELFEVAALYLII